MKDREPRSTWYTLTFDVRPLEGPCDWEKAADAARRALTDVLGPCLFDSTSLKRMIDPDT